ncbi:MAG: RtcB family protein, partial [Chloroflexi bacterium]|nr:RtcB family protein [Chloroflexota bacterium]
MSTASTVSYTVLSPGRVPIKSWVPDLDERTLAQATNLSNLPFATRHVALMPDAHAGYGMPIGGVLFAERAVVPYAIGVDIGCGVALAETDLTVEKLGRDVLHRTLAEIATRVPTGTSAQPFKVDREAALAEIGMPVPESIDIAWLERALNQLGTLGSGNHFLEIQADDEGRIFVMLHSGSRSLGKTICDAFHKQALRENTLWHSALPDPELAYLPVGTEGHAGYWAAMSFA